MSVENVFPNKDQFDTMNMFLAAIASNQGGISITKWADVQRLVRQGLHTKAFVVADQLDATWGDGKITFDVLDFDKHTPKDANLAHSLCMCSHDIVSYSTIPFCAPQLMYFTDVELPAGNYKFTLDHATYRNGNEYDGTYMFTLTQAIPADGGFRHTNIGVYKDLYTKSNVLGKYITTYGARPQRTAVETGLAVTEWDGTTACTDLGTFTAQELTYHTNDGKHNFIQRQGSGNNRWRDSQLRQWLNSDAPAVDASDNTTFSNWWTPQTVFDIPPSTTVLKMAGFLNGLDPELVAAIGEVETKSALSSCDRVNGATYDITYDKVWLQSLTEIFGRNNSDIAEGSQLDYWDGATNAERVKYYNASAAAWWTRSADNERSYRAWRTKYDGELESQEVTIAYGIVPAFCIV